MKLTFNEKQKELLRNTGIEPKSNEEYTDDEILKIEENVSDYFQMKGLTDSYEVNQTGLLCESILDMLD